MIQPDPTPAFPAQAAPQPIAYRPENGGLAGTAVDVLLVLVLLLGGTLALAWFARQKGWLRRWTTGANLLPQTTRGMRVEQALRLSPRTTVFRIVDGENRYLLVESTGTVRFMSSPEEAAGGGAHD
ncbi:MAG: hypothetical protein M3Q42_00420 [Pseudomonadota bacterium]|nr:hypothetical protein [Pseudomonadota bacterium]